MFEYKKLMVTKRGENILEWIQRNDGKPMVQATVHHFPVSSQKEVDAILAHPTFAGWKYGISVGYSRS